MRSAMATSHVMPAIRSATPTAAEPISLIRPMAIGRGGDGVGELLKSGVEQLDEKDKQHHRDQDDAMPDAHRDHE